MKSAMLILFVGITVVMCSSCKKTNPVGPSNTQPLWPLKVGNSWTFRVIAFDPTGAIIDTTYVPELVNADTLFEGNMWYQINGQEFYTNKSDGIWTMRFSTYYIASYPPNLLWKYPANAGEIYGDSTTVKSTNVSVTVPSGTYVCYEYYLSNSEPASINYVCPGIGIIATDVYLYTSGTGVFRQFRGELTAYTLK